MEKLNLKKFTCKFAVSFLIFGGTMAILPAENVSFIPTAYAVPATDNTYLIEKYTEEIRQNPKDVEAYFSRGLIYNGNDDKKAIEDFSMCIRLEPGNVRGYLHRGIAYRNDAQYTNAVKDFDKAISMDPKNATIYMNRGYAYHLAKDYDKARADYNTVLKINPGQDPELKKAIENMKKLGIAVEGLENITLGSYAYHGLGLVDYAQKNYQSALENFNMAIKDKEISTFFYLVQNAMKN